MKNKNKSIITLIIALVLCVVGLMTMVSCGGSDKNKISEIYITNADTPRHSYVQGQTLDLSDGKLTAVVNGAETKIPLDSTDVTVSGYDKDKLGDQVVTVAYGELTTSFTVNVIPRAVAENYETKYFVGDDFNKEMGKIKIATDDAMIFTVNMNSDKVSLVSFDSEDAGTATVTVLYSDGTNSYYCQFDVTVYEESNVEFTPPTKAEYYSHDGGIDVSGGFFTVTASDTTLTKNVPLTAGMIISGNDLTTATIENRENAKEQEVTVKYLNKEFTYTIYITYSSLSIVNYYAELLSDIDWEKATTDGLSDEESKAALDAINEYYKLSESQKATLSDEVKNTVGCAGAIAVSNLFYDELANYSDTLRMDTELNMYLVCSSYEKTAADLAKLHDADENINVYSKLLRKIEADFGEALIVEDTKVSDIIYVYSESSEESLFSILDHLVDVYSLVADIPDDWTAEDLKAYGDDILVATMQIHNSGYYKNGYSNYYTNILSRWRTNDDLFEILYSYFLYDYENGKEFMVNYMWGSMPMPGLLESWYQGLSMALYYERFYASYYSSNAILSDVSVYMYYYFYTLEVSNAIKTSDNQLLKDIYTTYNGDYMNQVYMYTYNYGYLYHTKAMIDSEAYHDLWSRYYTVLKSYIAKDLSATDDKDDICAMFDAFQALTPSELYGFLSSMNLMYSSLKGILPMLQYDSETAFNYFTAILRDYYLTYLNEANKDLFANLLLAMENYALVNYKDTALADFKDIMKQLIEDYSALSKADQDNFDEYVGVSYKKYLDIYNLIEGNTTVELTKEESALFDELKQSISDYFIVYSHIYSLVQSNTEVPAELYAVMHSLYAKSTEIYNTILDTANEGTLTALSAKFYVLFESEMSLEKAYYVIDNVSSSLLTAQAATITNTDGTVSYVTFWDLYTNYGFAEVLAEMSDALYYAYYNSEATLEKDYVTSLIDTVQGLTPFQVRILAFFNADTAYYNALDTYFASVLSESAKAVAEDLINAEKDYVAYSLDKNNTESYDSFISLMEQLKTDYEALGENEKSYLDGMYNFCLSKYLEIKANEQEAA